MEIIAILFTSLNSIALYTFILSMKIDELVYKSCESINNEFTSSYKIFCNVIKNPVTVESQLNDSINNLKKINFKGHSDFHNISKLKNDIILVRYGSLIGFSVSLISLILFMFLQINLNDLLLVSIPAIILFFELIFFVRILFIEKNLSCLKQKYLRREY